MINIAFMNSGYQEERGLGHNQNQYNGYGTDVTFAEKRDRIVRDYNTVCLEGLITSMT